MKLHKWPYWVKGGLLVVILAVAANEAILEITGKTGLYIPKFFSFLPNIGSNFLTPLFCHQTGEWGGLRCLFVPGMLISDILLLMQFFILGAFLGWLYGKIKNRKVEV